MEQFEYWALLFPILIENDIYQHSRAESTKNVSSAGTFANGDFFLCSQAENVFKAPFSA